MADITIKKGWSSCESCGSYDWHSVDAPVVHYTSWYDGHLSGGKSVEDMLIEVLEKLGHTVEVIEEYD